jgi:hypothetical protein
MNLPKLCQASILAVLGQAAIPRPAVAQTQDNQPKITTVTRFDKKGGPTTEWFTLGEYASPFSKRNAWQNLSFTIADNTDEESYPPIKVSQTDNSLQIQAAWDVNDPEFGFNPYDGYYLSTLSFTVQTFPNDESDLAGQQVIVMRATGECKPAGEPLPEDRYNICLDAVPDVLWGFYKLLLTPDFEVSRNSLFLGIDSDNNGVLDYPGWMNNAHAKLPVISADQFDQAEKIAEELEKQEAIKAAAKTKIKELKDEKTELEETPPPARHQTPDWFYALLAFLGALGAAGLASIGYYGLGIGRKKSASQPQTGVQQAGAPAGASPVPGPAAAQPGPKPGETFDHIILPDATFTPQLFYLGVGSSGGMNLVADQTSATTEQTEIGIVLRKGVLRNRPDYLIRNRNMPERFPYLIRGGLAYEIPHHGWYRLNPGDHIYFSETKMTPTTLFTDVKGTAYFLTKEKKPRLRHTRHVGGVRGYSAALLPVVPVLKSGFGRRFTEETEELMKREDLTEQRVLQDLHESPTFDPRYLIRPEDIERYRRKHVPIDIQKYAATVGDLFSKLDPQFLKNEEVLSLVNVFKSLGREFQRSLWRKNDIQHAPGAGLPLTFLTRYFQLRQRPDVIADYHAGQGTGSQFESLMTRLFQGEFAPQVTQAGRVLPPAPAPRPAPPPPPPPPPAERVTAPLKVPRPQRPAEPSPLSMPQGSSPGAQIPQTPTVADTPAGKAPFVDTKAPTLPAGEPLELEPDDTTPIPQAEPSFDEEPDDDQEAKIPTIPFEAGQPRPLAPPPMAQDPAVTIEPVPPPQGQQVFTATTVYDAADRDRLLIRKRDLETEIGELSQEIAAKESEVARKKESERQAQGRQGRRDAQRAREDAEDALEDLRDRKEGREDELKKTMKELEDLERRQQEDENKKTNPLGAAAIASPAVQVGGPPPWTRPTPPPPAPSPRTTPLPPPPKRPKTADEIDFSGVAPDDDGKGTNPQGMEDLAKSWVDTVKTGFEESIERMMRDQLKSLSEEDKKHFLTVLEGLKNSNYQEWSSENDPNRKADLRNRQRIITEAIGRFLSLMS